MTLKLYLSPTKSFPAGRLCFPLLACVPTLFPRRWGRRLISLRWEINMSGGKKPSCSASVSLYLREKEDLEMCRGIRLDSNKEKKTPAASYFAAGVRRRGQNITIGSII